RTRPSELMLWTKSRSSALHGKQWCGPALPALLGHPGGAGLDTLPRRLKQSGSREWGRFQRGEMPGIRRCVGLTAVSVAVLAAPPAAHAAVITNGDFETGNLSGWQVQAPASGSWSAYSGTTSPIFHDALAAPPQGSFAAVTEQTTTGTRILYQDVALEPGTHPTL